MEYTNNAAEIIFSLFEPQYKVMKQFQTPEGALAHFNLFTVRDNFSAFPWGKAEGILSYPAWGAKCLLKRLVWIVSSEGKSIPEEALFLSGRTKEAVFWESVA